MKRSDGRWMARYSTTDPETWPVGPKEPIRADGAGARPRCSSGRLRPGTAGHFRSREGRHQRSSDTSSSGWSGSRSGCERTSATNNCWSSTFSQVLAASRCRGLSLSTWIGCSGRSALKALATKTCNHVRATLRTCLNDAVREGLVSRNVASLARPLKLTDTRESVILTRDQIHAFVQMANSHRDGPVWVVALATGARQSELIGLRWSDVDLDGRVIHITKTLQRTPPAYRGDRGDWLQEPTKTRRSTTGRAHGANCLRISSEASRSVRLRSVLQVGRHWDDGNGDLVFSSGDGSPLQRSPCDPASSTEASLGRRATRRRLP